MTPREMLGELRRHDGRGRARQNGVGGGKPVEFGIDRLLHFDLFRTVLLDQADTVDGGFECGRYLDACQCFGGVIAQAMARELFKCFTAQCMTALGLAAHGVEQPDMPFGPGKDRGPCPANQPCTDNRNVIHSHNTFRLNSISRESTSEGPVCCTSPRSSTTARSDSASARSR